MRKRTDQIEFTVIAGSLKGRKVVAPDLGVTRPPLSRLRKSIFDFLVPYLDGARYLDLFTGTGSYLFEAVSRGAAQAVGVECEASLAEAINAHARKFGVADRLECLCDDVFEVIPRFHQEGHSFDIVMMAPPQYHRLIDATLRKLAAFPILADRGMILCQHDTSETRRTDFGPFPTLQQRKYGNTTFTILTNPPASAKEPD